MQTQVDLNERVPVEVYQPKLTTGLVLLSSTGIVVGEWVVTLLLTFFLLTYGDELINNILKILPSIREKRKTVEFVYAVEQSISRYLLTVSCINLILGLLIGTAMWLLGMPSAVLWGAMATILNFVPFIGAIVGSFIVFLVAILSFDSLVYASMIPIVYFSLTALEGNIITPHLLGRSMSLNPIIVFLSLTFWGWMWGIGGAVVAIPIIAALKVGFEHFQSTQQISLLLSGNSLK
jgi:predicted PurR-regulated permease PerM